MRVLLLSAAMVASCEPPDLTPTPSPTALATPTPTETFRAPAAPEIRSFKPSPLVTAEDEVAEYCVTVRDPDSVYLIRWEHWITPNVGDLMGTQTSLQWQQGEAVACWFAIVDFYGSPQKVTLHMKVTDQTGLTDTISVPWTITDPREQPCPNDWSCSSLPSAPLPATR